MSYFFNSLICIIAIIYCWQIDNKLFKEVTCEWEREDKLINYLKKWLVREREGWLQKDNMKVDSLTKWTTDLNKHKFVKTTNHSLAGSAAVRREHYVAVALPLYTVTVLLVWLYTTVLGSYIARVDNGKVIPAGSMSVCWGRVSERFSQVVGQWLLPLGGEGTTLPLLNRRDISR